MGACRRNLHSNKTPNKNKNSRVSRVRALNQEVYKSHAARLCDITKFFRSHSTKFHVRKQDASTESLKICRTNSPSFRLLRVILIHKSHTSIRNFEILKCQFQRRSPAAIMGRTLVQSDDQPQKHWVMKPSIGYSISYHLLARVGIRIDFPSRTGNIHSAQKLRPIN